MYHKRNSIDAVKDFASKLYQRRATALTVCMMFSLALLGNAHGTAKLELAETKAELTKTVEQHAKFTAEVEQYLAENRKLNDNVKNLSSQLVKQETEFKVREEKYRSVIKGVSYLTKEDSYAYIEPAELSAVVTGSTVLKGEEARMLDKAQAANMNVLFPCAIGMKEQGLGKSASSVNRSAKNLFSLNAAQGKEHLAWRFDTYYDSYDKAVDQLDKNYRPGGKFASKSKGFTAAGVGERYAAAQDWPADVRIIMQKYAKGILALRIRELGL